MSRNTELHLYEELMLLALRDKEGTFAADDMSFSYTLAGAILSELLLLEVIALEPAKKKKMVRLKSTALTGDPIIDECLKKLAAAKRRGSLSTWVSRFGGLKKLRHRAAQQLCRRGILRADEKSVLLIFSKKIYPELDPGPERELVARLREAIFSDTDEVAPATAIQVALADKAGVLKNAFDKKELKARKKRIENIAQGVATAAAVKEVVEGIQAALIAVMAASTAASATSAAS
jgi:hypothetical protein